MLICYLPDEEWINFDHIRSFQLEKEPFLIMITWASGDRSIYRGDRAAYLLAAHLELTLTHGIKKRLMS